MGYIWLSFRDPDINLNLGCAIVEARNMHEAVTIAHDLGINPGGEVLSTQLTEQQAISEGLELNRLYSREELMAMDYKTIQSK